MSKLKDWIKGAIGVGHPERKIIIVASAHKVGSTWLYKLINECGFITLPLPELISNYNTIVLDSEGERFLDSLSNGKYVFKSHSAPYDFSIDGVYPVTILRDPRDVLISASFFLANISEDRGGWGPKFANKDTRDRIAEVIEKGDFLLDLMSSWASAPNTYKVRYEMLKENTYEELAKLMDHCGIEVIEEQLRNAIAQNDFNTLPVEEKSKKQYFQRNYRKGIVGDWRNHFDDELLAIFKTAKAGRWNTLVQTLDYEKDASWEL